MLPGLAVAQPNASISIEAPGHVVTSAGQVMIGGLSQSTLRLKL